MPCNWQTIQELELVSNLPPESTGPYIALLRQKADRQAPKHRRRLTTWQVFRQVERRFHSRDSNRQPLPWDLGISPPSSNSLRSSRTPHTSLWNCPEIFSNIFPGPPKLPIEADQPRNKALPWGPEIGVSHVALHAEGHLANLQLAWGTF